MKKEKKSALIDFLAFAGRRWKRWPGANGDHHALSAMIIGGAGTKLQHRTTQVGGRRLAGAAELITTVSAQAASAASISGPIRGAKWHLLCLLLVQTRQD